MKIDYFIISEAEFQTFITNHSELKDVTNIVPETNSQIKGSYAMVIPLVDSSIIRMEPTIIGVLFFKSALKKL